MVLIYEVTKFNISAPGPWFGILVRSKHSQMWFYSEKNRQTNSWIEAREHLLGRNRGQSPPKSKFTFFNINFFEIYKSVLIKFKNIRVSFRNLLGVSKKKFFDPPLRPPYPFWMLRWTPCIDKKTSLISIMHTL